jgi:hypothetical protein
MIFGSRYRVLAIAGTAFFSGAGCAPISAPPEPPASALATHESGVAVAVGGDLTPEEAREMEKQLRRGLMASSFDAPPAPRPLMPGEAPPAPRSCAWARGVSPNNECALFFVATAHTLRDSVAPDSRLLVSRHTTARLACSSIRGGFERPVVHLYEDVDSLRLRWLDAQTAEIGQPVTATFTPLRASAENFGQTVTLLHTPIALSGPGALPVEQLPPVVPCVDTRAVR